MTENTFTQEADAHASRRTMINKGIAVSLIAFDSTRNLYVFDSKNVSTWTNEFGDVVTTPDQDMIDFEDFKGTAYELAEHFNGKVIKINQLSVRLALPCGPNCLKQNGCWSYRSFYPVP